MKLLFVLFKIDDSIWIKKNKLKVYLKIKILIIFILKIIEE